MRQAAVSWAAPKAAANVTTDPVLLTIGELVDRYIDWARTDCVKRDCVTPSNERRVIRMAVRPPLKLYAKMPARKFRPRHLQAVRTALVDSERYARKSTEP